MNANRHKRNFSIFIFLLGIFSLCGKAQESPTELKDQEPVGFQWSIDLSESNKWRDQETIAFNPEAKWQTNSVVIFHKDRIVYERYENGFNNEKPHRVWSVSKSLSSALWGIRLQELGKNENIHASQLSPLLSSPQQSEIRIKDLLQMSSGIRWNEFYEGNPFQSHVVRMLYLAARKDMATYTASQPMKDHPGQIFNYSSGETNLLMGILKNTFESEEEYANYPWEKLFQPLGMESVTWEKDGSGTFVGSSYLYMTPRDLARFGRLYLKKGIWEKQQGLIQIIPERYVIDSLKPSPASCQNNRKGPRRKFTYGYQWWLNHVCPEKNIQSFPGSPSSIFMALGHHGQTMAVFPEQELIAVRFGADKKGKFDRRRWLASLTNAIEAKENKQ